MSDLFTEQFVEQMPTIDGYMPKYDYQTCQLGYKLNVTRRRDQFRGFGSFDDEDKDPEEIVDRSVTFEFMGQLFYGGIHVNVNEVWHRNVVSFARAFIREPSYELKYPEHVKWLKENAKDLSNSIRYWRAYEHRQEVRKVEAQIKELQGRVRCGLLVQGLMAYEVVNDVDLTGDDRLRKYIEFGGNREEYNGGYRG